MSKQNWTLSNIPDLSGKNIIVTGGNSGLGYEAVKAFGSKGANVILACRNLQKGEQAKAEILKVYPQANIEVEELDLMEFASIKKFAEKILENYDHLDVLLNNAGIMTTPYFLTKDGLEAQNGTNHFGHFALTGRLIELIKKTPKSRVVTVSSNAHKYGKMDFSDPFYENGKGYSRMDSYARSKISNLLFTYELQRKFEENKIDSMAIAAHPGGSKTNLARHIDDKWWFKVLMPIFKFMMQDQAQGALPEIRASVDSDVKGGEYYGPDGFNEMTGYPVLVSSNKASHNKEDAKKLWKLSEEITKVHYF